MWRESFVQTNCEVHLLKVLPPLYDVLPLYVQSTLSRVYTHPYPRNPRTQHDRLYTNPAHFAAPHLHGILIFLLLKLVAALSLW